MVICTPQHLHGSDNIVNPFHLLVILYLVPGGSEHQSFDSSISDMTLRPNKSCLVIALISIST